MFELELDAVLQRHVPVFQAVAKHQPVQRDIAVWVHEAQSHADLLRAVWAAPTGGLLRDALLFDIYRPKSAAPAAMAGLASGMATRKIRLVKPAPSKRAASISCGARSTKAARTSKYT